MRISQRSIEEVRERTDIVEVASEFTALKRQGVRYAGLCPYPDHQEKTPSFSVSPDRGFYYCFGCLEANERIWTSRGLIPIAAAEVGDEVVGIDGRRETITDKWFKSGPTLRIKTGAAKEGIELTPDHWCVFVKREEALRAISKVHPRYAGGKEVRLSSRLDRQDSNAMMSVEQASDVRVGDFWLYPVIPTDERKSSPLPGEHLIKPYTKGPRRRRISNLQVNAATAWLYGVFLAEGSSYRGGVKWSFGGHEERTLAERVVHVLHAEFGRSATKVLRRERNLCEVTCSSTDLSALFGYWFGRGCENKRVPLEALSWTQEDQAALIRGYLDGDGHTSGGVAPAGTVSEELAYGIFALCVQAGKVCSLSTVAARTGKDGVNHKKCYYVHVLSKESIKGFFAEIDGTRYFWSVVQQIDAAREEPVTVVDITTTGSHTFLTKMGATHNCQKGGDAIKLVTDLKNLSFAEAVSYLAERSGVDLEFEGSSADSRAAQERNARRRKIHKALAAAAVYYHKYLLRSQSPEAKQAREYLRGRGFKLSTIEEFRLGFAPPRGRSGFVESVRRVGIEHGTLRDAGLLSARGGERFSGRITFPISDRRGRIVGFGARALREDQQPKYLNSPETELFSKRELLYGFPQVAEAVRRERAVLIVEGYTDVLMLYQSGVKNVVATLGTATTPSHLRTLSGYADRIYMLFDPDTAGEKALERADATVRELERGGDADTVAAATSLKLDLRVVRLTEDPADWLLGHSPDEFREVLSGAGTLLEYLFRRKAERARGADAAERSRMLSEIQDLIRRIEDPVFYRDALRIAAEALGVSPREIESGRRERAAATTPSSPVAPASPLEQAGQEVLTLIVAHPDLAARALEQGTRVSPGIEPLQLRTEDFANETQAALFRLLREHPGEDLDSVLSDGRARDLMDHLVALGTEAEEVRRNGLVSSEVSVREAWLRLAILSRERQKRDTPDYDQKERLQAEIIVLKEALRAVSAGP